MDANPGSRAQDARGDFSKTLTDVFVVLDADPLTDIRNTNTIRYVMKNGRLYEGATLNEVWPRQRAMPTQPWQENAMPAAGIRN